MKIDLLRRSLIKKSTFALVLPIIGFNNCGSGSTSSNTISSSSSDTSDTTSKVDTVEETTTTVSTSSWSSGDTSLITDDFPDTSIFELSTQCNVDLTSSTTEGPCYLGVAEKTDISEGRTGLPMMLSLQLIDNDCNPLEGYSVEVWHCDNEGIYSGDETQSTDSSSFAGSFCTNNDSAAEASVWYRGVMTTDSEGRVDFKSCFPGWYSGRTIHIHFRIKDSDNEYVVSQFCFSDDFCEEICTSHELYKDRGVQDTPLSAGNDTVFPSSDYDEYIMNTQQNSDGSLLAYKRIVINA